MSDTVIKVENLSKRYLLGRRTAERERYVALRDVIVREARQFGRKAVDLMRGRQIVQGDKVEEFWALKDISFEVKHGEVLGIIGRNGAGKSTLLKILSRITEPTEGRVELHGRVASLLEVGTGFHPELTGRENIFLNGAVLGMTRAEIRKKFDEIVDFAEVEQFLDTPVKRYSSGMYVRLAFSIAAHLEPEILIVDEVLAVGDAEFQKKCLGKMSDVASQGRTVLFVSHNIYAIRMLCTKGVVLNKGHVQNLGTISDAINSYNTLSNAIQSFSRPPRFSTKPTLVSVSIVLSDDREDPSVLAEVVVAASEQTTASIEIALKDSLLAPVGIGSLGMFHSKRPVLVSAGLTRVMLKMSTAQLANGEYLMSVFLTHPFVEFFDRFDDCVRFQINFNPVFNQLRKLEQNWGYGSFLITLEILQSCELLPDSTELSSFVT